MSNWHIGQRVKCIRRGPLVPEPRDPKFALWTEDYKPAEPQNGSYYTIRKIFPALDDAVTFWLDEIEDDFVAYHEEMFQPIDDSDGHGSDAQHNPLRVPQHH